MSVAKPLLACLCKKYDSLETLKLKEDGIRADSNSGNRMATETMTATAMGTAMAGVAAAAMVAVVVAKEMARRRQRLNNQQPKCKQSAAKMTAAEDSNAEKATAVVVAKATGEGDGRYGDYGGLI